MHGRLRVLFACLCVLVVIGSTQAFAQNTVETVSNRFIKAHVITPERSGRFWITSPQQGGRDPVRFLFGPDPGFVTSNIVFRIARGTDVTYYCNQPDNYFSWRPTPPSGRAVFKPYDSMTVSGDTIKLQWLGMSGYNVTMRIIAERPTTIYDTGGDLLIEFSYVLQPFAPAGDLGILLMLDTFNSQAESNDGGGQGDKPSVLTSMGYLPVYGMQSNRRFTLPDIPEWYHVGNFRFNDPLNDLMPVHRLSGVSHGGKPLTPPNMFAVGDWQMFRSIAWDLPSSFSTTNFVDCATIVRWEGLGGEGTVRTAFGLSDKGANNLFTCRDDQIFVDIRAPRLITQAVRNGPYSQNEFDVEVWATNLSEQFATSPRIRLQSPINSFPSFPRRGDRLILDSAATSPDTTVYIGPKQTVKLRWRLKVNPLSTDTLAQLVFFAKYGAGLERRFLEDCAPLITVRGWQDPPPPRDTLAPRIDLVASGRAQSVYWQFDVYDRHANYAYDLGLVSPLTVLASQNVAISYSQYNFPLCDTTQTVRLNITVVDTSRPASFSFRAIDCAGNDSIATVVYGPRPDTFPPDVVVVSESGSHGPVCNVRHYEFTLLDQRNQTPTSGDHGFGAVVVDVQDNFRVAVNGGAPIAPFARRVTVVADVIDSMRDGQLVIRAFDFAGNESVIVRSYCTLPDVLPPRSIVTPVGTGRWQVAVSDRRAWDRGLRDIAVLDNIGDNMRIPQPPVISVGDPTSMFTIEAIDLTVRGELVLEIRDTLYAASPSGHADTIRVLYTPGQPPPRDTLAPNITFAARAGSNGAVADVTVDEIHFINGRRYAHDTGLDDITVLSLTPNMELTTQIQFFDGDTTTTFGIRVIDTLAIGIRDSIVIRAVDRAGNVNVRSYVYPIAPDTKAPIFDGVMDPARTTITAMISDARLYDRGLGSIALEDATNLIFRGGVPNISGRSRDTIRFNVPDPAGRVAGTFVLTDYVGVVENNPEGPFDHVVRIPFSLPSVTIGVAMPDIVEGGEDIVAAIIAQSDIDDDVDSIGFTLSFTGATGAPVIDWRESRIATTSLGLNRIAVLMEPDRIVRAGDTIGTLRFATTLSASVYDVRVQLDDAVVNGGTGHIVRVRVGSDDEESLLRLPPPLMRITGDSVTYVNGDCDRILTGTRRLAKPNALAILGIRPQPIIRSRNALVELDLRNLPASGATAELIAVDGAVVARAPVEGATTLLTRRSVSFADVAHGTYALRIIAQSGVDQVMIVVIE